MDADIDINVEADGDLRRWIEMNGYGWMNGDGDADLIEGQIKGKGEKKVQTT